MKISQIYDHFEQVSFFNTLYLMHANIRLQHAETNQTAY